MATYHYSVTPVDCVQVQQADLATFRSTWPAWLVALVDAESVYLQLKNPGAPIKLEKPLAGSVAINAINIAALGSDISHYDLVLKMPYGSKVVNWTDWVVNYPYPVVTDPALTHMGTMNNSYTAAAFAAGFTVGA